MAITNEYSSSSYTYPIDLITNNEEYGKSYVVFYINVTEDSRALAAGEQTVNIASGSRLTSAISGYSVPVGKLKDVVSKGFNSIYGINLSDEVSNSKYASEINSVSDFIGDTAEYFLGSSDNLFSKPQKRLKTAIALYTPNDLSIRYGMDWQEISTFEASALLQGATEGLDAIERSLQSDNKSGGSIGSLIGDVAGGFALGKFPQFSPALGLAMNPKKEQQFTGVQFRTFAFDYVFTPRNEKEADIVQNIIYMFKYHMHPEYKSTHGFIYMYPSEFDIEYYFDGNQNDKIHKHTSCVLTDMNIDYTNNQGVMTFFPNGMPTMIRMTLHFKELLQLSKETIALGT